MRILVDDQLAIIVNEHWYYGAMGEKRFALMPDELGKILNAWRTLDPARRDYRDIYPRLSVVIAWADRSNGSLTMMGLSSIDNAEQYDLQELTTKLPEGMLKWGIEIGEEA